MYCPTVLLLFLGALSAAAQANIAQLIPREPSKRSNVLAGGGWALRISSAATCPAGSTACSNELCCPNSLVCNLNNSNGLADGASCCPDTSNCITPLESTPYCADDSWALWSNGDNPSPYFCCLQGQIGLLTGECVSGKQVVAASLTASFVGVSITSGAVFQTGSATKSGAPTAAGSGSSTITQAPTTTNSNSGGSFESGIKSAVSSAVSSALHNGAGQNGVGGMVWEGLLGAAVVALL